MRIPAPLRIYRTRLDLYLVVPAIGLMILGLLAVYSATEYPDSARAGFFVRQLLALPPALLVLLVALALPLRTLEDYSFLFYGIGILMLMAVLFFGVEVYGARRWLVCGPLRIQPSEIAKIVMVVALAHFLAGKRRDPGRIRNLVLSLAIILLPILFVLRQPDLGTSGAFAAIGLGMLIWAGLPMLHLFLMASPFLGLAVRSHWVVWGIFVAASSFVLWRSRQTWLVLLLFLVIQGGVYFGSDWAWGKLEPYQQARLTSFLHPEDDPGGAGYQIIQSKIAIGSGWIWGKGYRNGSQKALAFLPQQHTDFIFGVIGEEFGFLGSIATILLFVALILRGYRLALRCRNQFAGLVAVGVSTLLLYHAGVNLAMTVGLLPVTGLPLPLMSYGGSFLVSAFGMLGLLLNVSAHRYDY